ncbi:MAG: 2-C-methyl-D-erythritol 4-phosphate cytidylyltransferase [Balneolaceae bacterium]|nr:2-C-methyl-D-erythritol 4-phosphate cytidylyltransferase [Balneolaceae bacterium]
MDKQQLALIVPAAGIGERLGEEVPKPYLKLAGKTILEHTLSRFQEISGLGEVIVSTSDPYMQQTKTLLEKLFPEQVTHVVKGGKERQNSIRNALEKISGKTGLIAVHDAVRPFVESDDIERCITEASRWGGAVLAIPSRDTIKIAGKNNEITHTPDRKSLWQAQTPQVFWAALLREAYDYAEKYNFLGSDDSSLVEKVGGKVVLVEGTGRNFKITYPFDLEVAGYLLKQEKK